jgi:hypothetical protein
MQLTPFRCTLLCSCVSLQEAVASRYFPAGKRHVVIMVMRQARPSLQQNSRRCLLNYCYGKLDAAVSPLRLSSR